MKNPPPSPSDQPACGCCCSMNVKASAAQPRRGFLAKAAAIGLGLVALGTPLAVGLANFLNPLRQKRQAGRPYRVTTLSNVPEDGTPQKFPIIADRHDAWTLYKDVPIGSVFLRRTKDDKIEALSVICPHAGCIIDYSATGNDYVCPCHKARFNLEGQRTDKNSKSPRDMDTLPDVEVRDGQVWVKYETFRMGIAKKVVQS